MNPFRRHQTDRGAAAEAISTVSRRRLALAAVAATALTVTVLVGVGAGEAFAAGPAPNLAIHTFTPLQRFSSIDNNACLAGNHSTAYPTCDNYQVTVTNTGGAPTDGSPITIADSLPAGLTVQQIKLSWQGPGSPSPSHDFGPSRCDTATVQCTVPFTLAPDQYLEMSIYVTVDPSASGMLTDAAAVSGGGTPGASTAVESPVGSAAPPFGPSALLSGITNSDGSADTQAGSHPYEFSTRIELNSVIRRSAASSFITSVEDVKDVVVDLPLGLLGSAQATPTCTLAQLGSSTGCPPATQIGLIRIEPNAFITALSPPLYNIKPEHGVAAEFGYTDTADTTHVIYSNVVPTADGYVLRSTSSYIPGVPLTNIAVTLFGDPAAKDQSGNTPLAMFTNPTDCSGQPLTTAVHIDSWDHPGRLGADGQPDLSDPSWSSAMSSSPPVTGCNKLQFQPSMSVQPETTVADSPSGLTVEIKLPQSEDPSTLATPPLKDASVTLPPGFTVNPSSADGLGACTSPEIALDSVASPTCPDSSKIGTVQLTTPLLPGTLTGSIYLAREFDNPFHTLLAGYIVVDDPTTGVVIKIPGNLTPDPVTGQITGVFDNNPQFPFSDLKLDFKGGSRGVLATPESCGSFTTTASFSPWSFPDSGPASTPGDSFSIGSGCVSGFSPLFTAGTQNSQAGSYSPFVLSLARSDTDQNFSGLSVALPPGMLAKLAGVSECSDAQLASISSAPGTGANELANPACPENSQVGTVTTGSGVGPTPFFLGGKAYLTGPYKGAPYGLAVVVPAIAGPLDLGTVVVREALYVDPTTAQVTAVSDPFPTILDGIPLRIRRINVNLDRPGFTLSPTNCDPMNVTATATSIQGTTAALDSRFQVGGCASLSFSPKLAMSLTGKGKTKSGDHPTLTASLTQPFGGQANIQSAKVALPLSLALDPSNSQHVCNYDTAQAVHGGAVGCAASTIVGTATAVTPLLDQPLTGPVYLVQGIRFGNAGQRIRTLPSLLIPLRGQIALDLRAQSSVNGAQQLVTTFSTIPDAAVSKFTLQISGGPNGILVITGRGRTICGTSQVANANFGAQSGKTNTQNVTMSTPCGKVHEKTKKHKQKNKGKSTQHHALRPVPDRRQS